MHRRQFLQTLAAAAAVQACSTGLAKQVFASEAGDIVMQLGWLGSNGVLGEAAALKHGFYKDAGLNLTITPGGPNVDGIASVASGRAQVGQYSSSPPIMMARAAGIPIKAIAAGFQRHPFALFSLPRAPVRKTQDLIGKRIAVQATAVILVKAVLALNNIAEKDVEIIVSGADVTPVLNGQADVVTGWETNVHGISALGADRVVLPLWDTGVQLYANLYYASDDTIEKSPKVLESFVSATAKGWQFARDNPEAAVDALVELYPNLNRKDEMEAVGAVVRASFNSTSKQDGWGAMDPANWDKQIKLFDELKQFKSAPPTVADIMTDAVLGATKTIRMG
ncbi:ABC transporter substrate-binding protein [Rhizobium laguerreae]|jgi:NitT/TauT family transport system substrate-binding protein|uniref:ABC transporter substrate-binding protein n=1 Tax=Rhizobium laguerreae TaxID=1076926 RepID=UPI001C909B48|nr:ABC transporter substrate-binding protein [Rhizobium laguerreae]MBY3307713.1 ABC transporter substrate-binding protein [Rhizobium laguerreae]